MELPLVSRTRHDPPRTRRLPRHLVRPRHPRAAPRRHHQPQLRRRGRRPPLRRAHRRATSPCTTSSARNELAASRAAHAAGLSPAVRHAEPGVLVIDFIEGRTLTPEDVRDPANLDRLADLVRRCHRDDPAALPRPRADLLGLPGGARLRPHPRAERQPPRPPTCPASLAAAERLEAAVGPVEIVFGHNDLLAANIIDDGRRLWLVDWEYAGFNSPLFDLGGLASNAGMPPAAARGAARSLFRPPARRRPPAPRRRHDRRLAAARDHVEHGLGAPLRHRLRLRRLHRREPRPLRGRLRRLPGHERA